MKSRPMRDTGPRRIAALTAGLFVLMGLGLLGALFLGAWHVLGEPGPLANLLGRLWDPLEGRYGLLPFILGTVTVTVLALIVAVPLSLGVGITMAEQLPRVLREWSVRALTVLTAVPSVVFGWWGLQMVVPWVRTHIGGPGFSLLSAGLVLAAMLLPTLSLLFFEGLKGVPRAYHEGSAALGATPDQTLIRMVLPCAMPSLLQSLMVAVARAVGETMAVQMVIGGQTALPAGMASPGATLTTQLFTDLTVFPPGTSGHAVLDLMALILMAGMYFLVRLTARWGSPL